MKRFHASISFFAILLYLTIQYPATAAITYSGDIDPTDPNTWTSSTSGYIGKNSTGTVAVNSGSDLLSRYGYLGYESGSTGTVTVTGAGSTWTNSYGLYVGRSGNGTLNIEAGGQVSNRHGQLGYYSGSTGMATVTGAGSTWTNSDSLYVGREGSGTLTVSDGGVVTAKTLWASLSDLYGNGTITTKGAVLDADLIFDTTHGPQQTLAFGTGGTLNLDSDGTGLWGAGYKSEGTLRIADGVTVAGSSGYLGYYPGSTGTVTVTGTGSTWTNSDDLYVGDSGNGTLNIEAGGRVSNGHGQLGYWPDSTGTATVTGAGSMWTNSGNLYVGRYGSGTLTVSDGGVVTARTLWASLSDLYGNGIIATKGAVLDADLIFDATHGPQQTLAFGTGGTLNLDSDGTGNWGAGYKSEGTLRIADGVTVAGSFGYLGDESGSTGTATVTGAGSTWTNSSKLYVGDDGSGTLYITDFGVVRVDRTLTIDDNGDGDGFINMATGGMLALSGDADDSLSAFFDLINGTDAIRWWDPAVADWNLLTTATMGTDYTLEYIDDGGELDGYTLLTVTAGQMPGDANGDGQVDASDATILAGNWQASGATWSMGDFNGDGSVDASDATILAGNWQAGTNSNTVPEPGCFALLITLLAAGAVFVVKKRP